MVVKSIVPRNAFHLQFPVSRESDLCFIFLLLLLSLGRAAVIPIPRSTHHCVQAPHCPLQLLKWFFGAISNHPTS
ncbi:uncharacterized protein F5147DRAFT_711194 [Suillus discolor]|uniref:Uncharacterized protein n=1 Tax=Suillus discolor TaxID=1912936 RepID=A0A9P7F0Z2_9AGAM|nr:uncharacterized protein F5147DRAFT_711194 [Suillus discolor]KAG2099837.1 hypothetical protein F5147DRAFT_711194 [Suillus discolor]